MLSRKLLNLVLSMLVISSLLFGGVAPVRASTPDTQFLPAQKAAPLSPTDETKVPHYFGPYPNWANSPQVLTNAIVTIGPAAPLPGAVGNLLVARTDATDPTAEFLVINTHNTLPTGALSAFEIYAQAGVAYTFNAYVLRPTVNPDEYEVIFVSDPLTTNTTPGLQTFTLATPVAVQNGDMIAHYGQGIPFEATGGSDVVMSPVVSAPLLTDVFTVNDASHPLLDLIPVRTYSIAAIVTPPFIDPGTGAEAVAVVNPKTGGISAVTITSPGSGYLVAPNVTITAPGATHPNIGFLPASATAVISPGVVNSITVNETGFGFTAPTVSITGGGTPTINAVAVASGGVDNVVLLDGGSGYQSQPIVTFSPPLVGVTATGAVVFDAGTGTVLALNVTNPGSGYTVPPTITITDSTLPSGAVLATASATIGINQIDITTGGAGYDSVPTVTITEGLGGPDLGATATATVAVRGAVTAITVTNQGAGYLTPGIRKFVDDLPGLCNPATGIGCSAAKYIPLGVPDTTTYPGSDYYEIGLVQYRMQFHSDLPPTLLRGYVQLSTSVVPGNQVNLTNAMLNGPDVPIAGYQGVTPPHYLGPTIVATKDRPVRILFRNLLPIGSDGNLFLPVDATLMGAGMGPDMVGLDKDGDGIPDTILPGETGVPVMEMGTDSVMDAVRNPACGQLPKPAECFAENRATLHLHGGITPWISDGTPHQWITPAGENTNYPEGVSVHNVPDMNGCEADNDGCMTFFYTNQQSARLMFYHDHAWGITRLNVYAGEAAGYVITDETEQKLFVDDNSDPLINTAPFKDLGIGTPLIVQDKTFVSANIAQQDPTWDTSLWGGEGSLWAPHVYMPAQNPGDPSGMSGFGRWMYGPWFWPPANNVKFEPIANPYYNMDPLAVPPFSQPLTDSGFHDGLGNLKPCNLDDPNTWQYQSDPFCEPPLIPGTANVSVGMEAFNDTPLVNGTVYPKTTVDPKAYRFRILNAANDRFWNLSWYVADPTTGTLSEVALNPAEVEAALTDPVIFPTPDETKSPKGPSWIQIGTEGGFLPAPVVLPAQPTTWITDPTRFDVGNVDLHSLLLAPAERADVIVDFSQFRGKTLILYNDAPAAFPARVPSYDYYTGSADLSPVGVPSILPGYGPNTRTIMKVTVSNAAPALAFDRPNTTNDRFGQLQAAFAHHADGSGVFESGQNPIIVGQAAYNGAYGTNFASGGWCNSTSNPTARCDGFLRIMEQGGMSFKFDTLGLAKDGNGAQLSIPIEPKAIHDEMNSAHFDEFGRMTANLGLEAVGATPLLQNIVLYPYVNPATEILDSTGMPSSFNVTPIASATDGTQIWKITHNGVDTHPIHFHLYDVQLLNRVSWDNIVQPPEANELGWKDTVRISPLQDTIVAVRPIVPELPFGLPDSKRPLNPMMPLGARGAVNDINGTEAGFNNIGPNGEAWVGGPIVNVITDFNWEYVFHCHILSHEEMDMMRPVMVFVPRFPAAAPVLGVSGTTGSPVTLTWSDGTPVDYNLPPSLLNNWGNDMNEIGYRIARAEVAGGVTGAYDENFATALANQTTFIDTTTVLGAGYSYRVTAYNEAGDSASNEVQPMIAPPAAFVKTGPADLSTGQALNRTLFWAASTGAVSYEYCIDISNDSTCNNGGSWISTGTNRSAVPSGLANGQTYYWQVRAVNAGGTIEANGGTWWSYSTRAGSFSKSAPANGAILSTNPTLSWAASNGAASYQYCYDTINDGICNNGGTWVNTGTNRFVTLSGLANNITYYWQVQAMYAGAATDANGGWWSFQLQIAAPAAFVKTGPADLSTGQALNRTLFWAASTGAVSYEYCIDTSNDNTCNNGGTWISTGSNRSAVPSGLAYGQTYYWQVRAVNPGGTTEANGGVWWSFSTRVGSFNKSTPANGAINASLTPTLSWGASTGATSYEYCYDISNDGICNNGGTWTNTTNRFAVLSGLTNNTTYYWQVRAVYQGAAINANGGWWSFGTIP